MGLVLGTDPKALFVGEPNQIVRPDRLDPQTWKDTRFCTCGASPDDCAFWTEVRNRYPSRANLNPAPGFSLANLGLALGILSPFPSRGPSRAATRHGAFLEAIADVARQQKPQLELLIDGSKSIHSLDALARCPNLDVVVVHLVRDCVAVADSYKDRGAKPLYGVLTWAAVNIFLRLYVRRRGIPALTVGYGALCRNPETELARLNRFLSTSLVKHRLSTDVRREPYHLFAGNRRVRERIRGFAGLDYRPPHGNLSRFDRAVALGMGRLVRAFLRHWRP